MLLPVDITLVLKLQHEQVVAGTLMVHKVRLMTNRQISLIHLAILIAHKNGLKEEEWPNFEFYPCLLTSQISDIAHEQLSVGGILRPFRFKMTIYKWLLPKRKISTWLNPACGAISVVLEKTDSWVIFGPPGALLAI